MYSRLKKKNLADTVRLPVSEILAIAYCDILLAISLIIVFCYTSVNSLTCIILTIGFCNN